MRGIDKLGRIVIPMELRKRHGFTDGGRVEFIEMEDGILVRSSDLKCRLCSARLPDGRELPLCDECVEKAVSYYSKN